MEENDLENSWLTQLSSPARSALLHEGIDTLEKLSQFTEKEILKFHGIGPASIPVMKKLLAGEGLTFKEI